MIDGFSNVSTTISCPSGTTTNIPINRGVKKQGDPLSLVLFNMVVDELLEDIHSRPAGLSVGDFELSALAYADDLVLFGQDVPSMQSLINDVESFLQQRQMLLNSRKCTVLVSKLLPHNKKLYTSAKSKIICVGFAY